MMPCNNTAPNVVRYVSHCWRDVDSQRVDYLILMEWCGGGSVFELMESRRQERNRLKTREITEIFRDCCLAVAIALPASSGSPRPPNRESSS